MTANAITSRRILSLVGKGWGRLFGPALVRCFEYGVVVGRSWWDRLGGSLGRGHR